MNATDRAADVRRVCPHAYGPTEYGRGRAMCRAELEQRVESFARREENLWREIRTVADWERFRDERIGALRRSLGAFPSEPGRVELERTGRLAAQGYGVDKLVYETRPGTVVTALLYGPDPLPDRMPLIQVVHAHHTPKEHAELQDLGVNWARTGAAVLVPDLLGHGERREDPFGEREGYYSRYNSAMQLNGVGESLAGWMVWDLICGNRVLLGLPGADPSRLILIGSVAGGGDLAAIAAALDPSVTCSIPFNFGAGSTPRGLFGTGYWETTRNLPFSIRDGFAPWVIVAAVAPRHLVYAHEFAWDPDRDLAWTRLQRIYELYGVPERLGSMRGEGRCAPGPENTHCTHVGPYHRARIYPWLQKWFGMPPPLPEVQERRPPETLACLDDRVRRRMTPLRQTLARKADALIADLRRRLRGAPAEVRRVLLREAWTDLLGDTAPASRSVVEIRRNLEIAGGRAEVALLAGEPGIDIPMLTLYPAVPGAPRALLIGVAHHGKEIFLQRRAPEIARILAAGGAVCLADLRGTGETRPDEMHGLESEHINVSEDERMLGRSMPALQLGDLRRVIRHGAALAPVALWGESFSPPNPKDYRPGRHDSRTVDNPQTPNLPHGPPIAEPLAPFLVLLAALFEDSVTAVLSRRGLACWFSVYEAWSVSIPSDAVVPGLFRAGDVGDLAAALAPLPLRLEAPVDAWNRAVPESVLDPAYEAARQAYVERPGNLVVSAAAREDAAEWLLERAGGGKTSEPVCQGFDS